MIHIHSLPSYDLRVLEMCIVGVQREIDKRKAVIREMRNYLDGTGSSTAGYSHRNIIFNGPRIAVEITKLKVIKIELVYLYELSRLKTL